jgi:hypothetical protein
MQITYAVTWQGSDGLRSGRLELGPDALRLEGRNGRGPDAKVVRYDDVRELRLARSSGDRLHGRPTLLLELSDGSELKVASVAQPGIVAELADRLGSLTGQQNGVERQALVVPLRPGTQAEAEALLSRGPPFDPEDFGLQRHEVFLTDSEVVFVFEGRSDVFRDHVAAERTIWTAAEAWRPLIAGPIRLGLQAYAWPS